MMMTPRVYSNGTVSVLLADCDICMILSALKYLICSDHFENLHNIQYSGKDGCELVEYLFEFFSRIWYDFTGEEF